MGINVNMFTSNQITKKEKGNDNLDVIQFVLTLQFYVIYVAFLWIHHAMKCPPLLPIGFSIEQKLSKDANFNFSFP